MYIKKWMMNTRLCSCVTTLSVSVKIEFPNESCRIYCKQALKFEVETSRLKH